MCVDTMLAVWFDALKTEACDPALALHAYFLLVCAYKALFLWHACTVFLVPGLKKAPICFVARFLSADEGAVLCRVSTTSSLPVRLLSWPRLSCVVVLPVLRFSSPVLSLAFAASSAPYQALSALPVLQRRPGALRLDWPCGAD